jgi:hypothetical protein
MEVPTVEFSDHIAKSRHKYGSVTDEYYRLATYHELSDEDTDRLVAIYEQAEADPLLSFLINELDSILNQRLGLLDPKHQSSYEDQLAWLREHLQEIPYESESRKKMQTLLQELKYYSGPIDGVWGKRSEKAIHKLHQQAQLRLREEGFYHNKIDGNFAEKSITAVKRFQEARNLKADGVLGLETLEFLMK